MLERTLRILRACRLFNYKFVGITEYLALLEETEQLNWIPKCVPLLAALRNELKVYKTRADYQLLLPEDDRLSLWDFRSGTSG